MRVPIVLAVALAASLAGCAKDPPAQLDLVAALAPDGLIVAEISNVGGSATDVLASGFRLIASNAAVATLNGTALQGRADRFPELATLDPGDTASGVLAFEFDEEAHRPWTLIYKAGAERVEALVEA